MTRPYKQGLRAEKSAETRTRILAAARELMPEADHLQVEDIARRAGVSVPTLYSHFGSKGGLLSALTGQVESEAGLFAGFARVWQCRDGEAALRIMLDSTMRFWQEAWTFIEFALRVRRTDEELAARIGRLDESRLGHLEVICKRLRQEGRLRPGVTPAKAARITFALTTPYVYEALVVHGGLPSRAARQIAVDAAVGAVISPETEPVQVSAIDWNRLGLRPPVT
jgi:AcrR family transcriptional regulator